jgi:hypothetical protein
VDSGSARHEDRSVGCAEVRVVGLSVVSCQLFVLFRG